MGTLRHTHPTLTNAPLVPILLAPGLSLSFRGLTHHRDCVWCVQRGLEAQTVVVLPSLPWKRCLQGSRKLRILFSVWMGGFLFFNLFL